MDISLSDSLLFCLSTPSFKSATTLCFSCRLFLLPWLLCFVLIIAGVMWARGSKGDKQILRSFQSFWDFSNICQGFTALKHKYKPLVTHCGGSSHQKWICVHHGCKNPRAHGNGALTRGNSRFEQFICSSLKCMWYFYLHEFTVPPRCVRLRIRCMLCRPPEAKQMTGSGKPDVTPQHVLQLSLGDRRRLSGRPLG